MGRWDNKQPAPERFNKEDNQMKWIVAMILTGGLLIGSPVSADFYKYYDADGNVHFTDDYNHVPP